MSSLLVTSSIEFGISLCDKWKHVVDSYYWNYITFCDDALDERTYISREKQMYGATSAEKSRCME
jgi:hypothetical protein